MIQRPNREFFVKVKLQFISFTTINLLLPSSSWTYPQFGLTMEGNRRPWIFCHQRWDPSLSCCRDDKREAVTRKLLDEQSVSLGCNLKLVRTRCLRLWVRHHPWLIGATMFTYAVPCYLSDVINRIITMRSDELPTLHHNATIRAQTQEEDET